MLSPVPGLCGPAKCISAPTPENQDPDMNRPSLLSLTLLCTLNLNSASAADDPRIQELAARIQALETNAEQLRAQAAQAQADAAAAMAELQQLRFSQRQPEAAPQPAPAALASSSSNAFNPAISLILNGVYSHHSLDPEGYQRSGFPLVGEGRPSEQGLKLGESEISMSSNIDDKFYGQMTLAFGSEDGDTEVGIEEAFIDTTALPNGFTLRAGRFYSNIGYLNSHHRHTDGFVDRPLAYQAFLANQYGDDGVQLRWVAPTDLYLEVGAELMRGDNYPAGGAARQGVGVRTAFAHLGGDIGTEQSWLAGISMLDARSVESEDGFSGDSKLYIADATWKWAPRGNFKDGGVTLRAEYFRDDRDGSLADPESGTLDLWHGRRSGAYMEGVYRINRRWDTGYRYDRLWADDSGPLASDHDPVRHSLMLTWRNSEFSLFRLQFSQDEPNAFDTDNAVYLQYQTSLGAHGAHKF